MEVNPILVNQQQQQPTATERQVVHLPAQQGRPILPFVRWCFNMVIWVLVSLIAIMCVIAGAYLALLVIVRAVSLLREAFGL